jgi:transposase
MSGVTKLVSARTIKIARSCMLDLGKYGTIANKLKAVIATQQHGISKVAEIFNISRSTLTLWIKSVNSNKIEELTVAGGRGRKPKLDPEQLSIVEGWLIKDPSTTVSKLADRILRELNVDVAIPTLYIIVRRLSFSYITPRPKHYKQNKIKQEEFKKKAGSKNKGKPRS